jgi:hypothetical protein
MVTRSASRCWITSRRCLIRARMARFYIRYLKSCFWCCRRRDADPLDILRWFVRRWSIEVTFCRSLPAPRRRDPV